MNYKLVAILSFSISIAACIAAIRWRKIDKKFIPFLILVWLALVNEIISFLLIRMGYSNAVNANIYSLIESILILVLFKNLKLFGNKLFIFFGLLCLYLVTWLVENFIIASITHFSSYFIIVYSFTNVLMSIHMINWLIGSVSKNIRKDSIFLLCISFIGLYTYNVLVEIFWIYGLNASEAFRFNVYNIMSFINLFVNVAYALAILWMPPKQRSILQ